MNEITTTKQPSETIEAVVTRPVYQTRKSDHGIELSVDLPGVSKENLGVKLEGQLLTVTGERHHPENLEEHSAQSHEKRRYELKLKLHQDLDPEKVSAEYRDGVLTLGLQKREELAPRKIDVVSN